MRLSYFKETVIGEMLIRLFYGVLIVFAHLIHRIRSHGAVEVCVYYRCPCIVTMCNVATALIAMRCSYKVRLCDPRYL